MSPTRVKLEDGRFIYVPCRNCIPCKINKTSEWTMRILMEKATNPNCQFLTLTYNNDNLPKDRGLHKDDLQDFFKSFRQELEYAGGDKIKYFACGEYGDNPQRLTNGEYIKRPHYHSIIFGIDDSMETRMMINNAWKKQEDWKLFGKTWRKTLGNVSADSASYVAGYCQKKLFGKYADWEYGDKQPPFQLQSQRIGEKYFLEHAEQYIKDGFIFFNGKKHPIPETWKRKFNIDLSNNTSSIEFKEQRVMEFVLSQRKKGYQVNYLNIFELWAQSGSNYNLNDLFLDLNKLEAYQAYLKAKNNLKKRGQL